MVYSQKRLKGGLELKRTLAFAAAVALAAGPAAAETWWIGAANPAGVILIDFDKVTTDEAGRRVAIERVLVPKGSAINGKPIAVIVAQEAYDCGAETARFLGGNATTDTAEIVVRIPPDAEARPLDPKTDGWKVMKLVCAGSDAERAEYGRFVGETDFAGLLAKWQPPARGR